MRKISLLGASAAPIVISAFCAVSAAHANPVSETGMAGAYTVILKVLPAESFSRPNTEMVRDGGAKPVTLTATPKPNHHMVVFVKKGANLVENAKVSIRYRELKPRKSGWINLPVVRMHVAGKGRQTTHYGNNVALLPGSYRVLTMVNGKGPARFKFTLPASRRWTGGNGSGY